MLLFRPILEAKFLPSQIKLQIILLHLAKTVFFATIFDKCVTKLKPLDYTFFYFIRNLARLFLIFSVFYFTNRNSRYKNLQVTMMKKGKDMV